jgi:hypothetical protein
MEFVKRMRYVNGNQILDFLNFSHQVKFNLIEDHII